MSDEKFSPNRAVRRSKEWREAVEAKTGGTVVHVSPSYPPGCDHDWPDDPAGGGTDTNGCCTKCGMSFIRYIHTEMP